MCGYRYNICWAALNRKISSQLDIVPLARPLLSDIRCTTNHRETANVHMVVVDKEAHLALVWSPVIDSQAVNQDRALAANVISMIAEWAPRWVWVELYDIVVHILMNLKRIVDKELSLPWPEDIPRAHLALNANDTG